MADKTPVAVLQHHTAPVTAIAIAPNGTTMASASDDMTVALFTIDQFAKKDSAAFNKTILTFNSKATCVAFSPTSSSLAAAATDEIKVVTIMDSTQVIKFQAHSGPIKALAFSPSGDHLASVGSDGLLKIWLISKLSADDVEPIHQQKIFTASPWNPDGTVLAVPMSTGVLCITSGNWTQSVTLETYGHSRDVTTIAWSPNGLYLASTGLDKNILVWDVAKKEPITYNYKHEKPILSISWKPDANCVSFIDANGQVGTHPTIVPADLKHPVKGCLVSNAQKLNELFDSPDIQETAPVHSRIRKQAPKEENDKEHEENGEDDDKSEEEPSNDFLDEEADEVDGEEHEDQEEEEEEEDDQMVEDGFEDEGDEMIDDEDDYEDFDRPVKSVKPDRAAPVYQQPSRPAAKTTVSKVARVPVHRVQEAFQPGSTYKLSKTRYFMAYNMIGMIIKREDDNGTTASIEIEFNETAFNRKITMPDNNHYQMAALGPKGAIFASKTVISFQPFDSLGPNSDWSYTIDASTDTFAGVAIGSRYVVAVTSNRMLRIFTLGGTQFNMLALSGDLLTLNMSDTDRLAVAYCCGAATNLLLIDLTDGLVSYDGPLPISPNASLRWLGFASDSNVLTTVDSSNLVRQLVHLWPSSASRLEWAPVMDLSLVSKSSSVNCWPIGLSATSINCVLCGVDEKNPTGVPLTNPRPMLTPLAIAPPLLGKTSYSKDASADENFFKARISFSQFRHGSQSGNNDLLAKEQAAFDSMTLRAFRESMQAGKPQRSIELCQQLQLKKSLSIAIKLANDNKATFIAQQIVKLMTTAAPAVPKKSPFPKIAVTKGESIDSTLKKRKEVPGGSSAAPTSPFIKLAKK
eukprot:gene7571-8860_t